MIRTVLTVAGVALIGLGFFGGQLIGNFTGESSDQMISKAGNQTERLVVPAAAAPAVNTVAEASSDTSTVQPADASVTTTVNAVAAATPQAIVPDTVKPETVNAGTIIPEQAPLNSSSSVTEVIEAVKAMKAEPELATAEPVEATPAESVVVVVEPEIEVAVSDASEDEAEPMAPAQTAGDLAAMAEQAKSSSRNEEVKIAQTILASSRQTAAEPGSVVVPVTALDEDVKADEVSSVLVSTTGDLNSDILVVVKDKVNLRDGPSIDHPIVLQLGQGQELMEFKREGKWVHVGAYGTEGKIGWVHQRLVGPPAN